jgi:hypothetical protein
MVYDLGKAPFHARQTVLGAVNSLIRKSNANNELWKIVKLDVHPAAKINLALRHTFDEALAAAKKACFEAQIVDGDLRVSSCA